MKLGYTMRPELLYARYRTPYCLFQIVVFMAPQGTSLDLLRGLEREWHEYMQPYRIRGADFPVAGMVGGTAVFAGGTEIFRTSQWGYVEALEWAETHCGWRRNLAAEAISDTRRDRLYGLPMGSGTAQSVAGQSNPPAPVEHPAQAEQDAEQTLTDFAQTLEVHPCRVRTGPHKASKADKKHAVPISELTAVFSRRRKQPVSSRQFARSLYELFDAQAVALGYPSGADWLVDRRGHEHEAVAYLRFRSS